MNKCFCHYKNLILIYLYMSKNTAIAYPDGNRSRFFKGQDFINRARSFRDAAGVQYDAAAEVVGRLVTKEGRAQAAQDVLLTPFSTKHQHYFEAIQKFLKLKVKKDKTATKAIGISEITDYLDKKADLDEIITKIAIKTRQYAKRQSTWSRGNMSDWTKVQPRSLNRFLKKI